MKKQVLIVGILVAGLGGTVQVNAVSYSGTLSASDGSLIVQGLPWSSTLGTRPSLQWSVTEVGPNRWHYQYTLSVGSGSIGCVIVEASSGGSGPVFGTSSMFSPTSVPDGWTDEISVGAQSGTPDNPGMPAGMYGIRFTSAVDPTTLTLGFDSDRPPMWGDFYARTRSVVSPITGKVTYPMLNYVYNAGFTANDIDPRDPPSSGSVQRHILVPDSKSSPPDTTPPEPNSVPCAALDIAGAWVAHLASPPETLTHTFTLTPLDSEKARYLVVVRTTGRAASAIQEFPEVSHLSDPVGVGVVNNLDNVEFTVMGYGYRMTPAVDTLLSIIVMSGELRGPSDGDCSPDTLTGTASVSYYTAEQDTDGDGFPDTPQETLCLPYDLTLKRVTLRAPCP